MNESKARLAFLTRVVEKEARHLQQTDERVFVLPLDLARAQSLDTDVALAEQVDAFVARFGRLQDTLGDKLLPALLNCLGEPVGPVADNLDKAERFTWITSADDWLNIRALRNKMVHEYIEDLSILVEALNEGHAFVQELLAVTESMRQEARHRGLLE